MDDDLHGRAGCLELRDGLPDRLIGENGVRLRGDAAGSWVLAASILRLPRVLRGCLLGSIQSLAQLNVQTDASHAPCSEFPYVLTRMSAEECR